MKQPKTNPLLPWAAKGKHRTHRMRVNSIAANRTVDHHGRAQDVLATLRSAGYAMTDRQICTALGSQDMNYARPAITKLIDEGTLYEFSKTKCPTTGRPVRLVWITGAKQ